MLAVIGLFLMLVVARLTERAYLPHATLAGRASGFFARRVIDAIAVVGWLCDRVPISTPGRVDGSRRVSTPAATPTSACV